MRELAVKNSDIKRLQTSTGQSAVRALAGPAGEVARELWEGVQLLLEPSA